MTWKVGFYRCAFSVALHVATRLTSVNASSRATSFRLKPFAQQKSSKGTLTDQKQNLHSTHPTRREYHISVDIYGLNHPLFPLSSNIYGKLNKHEHTKDSATDPIFEVPIIRIVRGLLLQHCKTRSTIDIPSFSTQNSRVQRVLRSTETQHRFGVNRLSSDTKCVFLPLISPFPL